MSLHGYKKLAFFTACLITVAVMGGVGSLDGTELGAAIVALATGYGAAQTMHDRAKAKAPPADYEIRND